MESAEVEGTVTPKTTWWNLIDFIDEGEEHKEPHVDLESVGSSDSGLPGPSQDVHLEDLDCSCGRDELCLCPVPSSSSDEDPYEFDDDIFQERRGVVTVEEELMLEGIVVGDPLPFRKVRLCSRFLCTFVEARSSRSTSVHRFIDSSLCFFFAV